MSYEDESVVPYNAWRLAFFVHCAQLTGFIASFFSPYAWWPIFLIFPASIALLGDASTPSLTDSGGDGPFQRKHGWAALKTALIYWLGAPLAAMLVFGLTLYETPYYESFIDSLSEAEHHPLEIMIGFASVIDDQTKEFLFTDFVLIVCTLAVVVCYLEQIWRPVKWAYKARKHRNER